ncbi:MAG: hypothetical protein MZV63_14555 [Marinilabiliales bacterium]|nr:hypothetical protein [Marinilabiliales bacterium]
MSSTLFSPAEYQTSQKIDIRTKILKNAEAESAHIPVRKMAEIENAASFTRPEFCSVNLTARIIRQASRSIWIITPELKGIPITLTKRVQILKIPQGFRG